MRSLVVLVLAATLLGCRERKQTASRSADSIAAAARPRIGYDKSGRPSAVALSEVVVTGTTDPLPLISADISSMVIRTADVSIEVDSLEPAVARVRELAARFGGYVASTQISTGKAQLRNARLEVKIPAQRFDERPVGSCADRKARG